MKEIVIYFSASGVTKDVALKIANILSCDIHEIIPEKIYTEEDLNWQDENSRSSIEMKNLTFRPPIKNTLNNIAEYDKIYLGFPIWWGTSPTIINTFLESYDLKGKTIIPFATSGGSGIGNTVEELKKSVSEETTILEGKILSSYIDEEGIKSWLVNIN